MLSKLQDNPSRVRLLFWIIGPALGLLQALAQRNDIDHDGVSYLDMAERFWHGGYRSLLNAYWSPLYPWLLAHAIRFSPLYWEALALHLVNFGIYLLVLFSFDLFLDQLQPQASDRALPEWAIRAFGYSLVLWCCLILTPLGLSHPDLLVMAVVFCVAAITARIRNKRFNIIWPLLLGVLLGLGYLAKAAMFPLAFVFLGVAFLAARRSLLLMAPAMFALIAGAYILMLSHAEHRITFGDSAKINYAMWVNASGSPIHPGRKVFEHPAVYVYTEHLAGTNPGWTDPSYWRAGVEPKLNLRRQADVVHRSFDIYFSILTQLSGVLAGLLALILIDDTQATLRRILNQWPLYIPALAAFTMYSLVHVELRFVGAFVALICMALFLGIRISPAALPFGRAIVLAIVILLGAQVAWDAAHNLIRLANLGESSDWRMAKALEGFGVERGDKVAIIDPVRDLYWARLAGVTLTGKIGTDDAPEFWALAPEVKSRIAKVISSFGIKALVAQGLPSSVLSEGWSEVEKTDYYVLPVRSIQ